MWPEPKGTHTTFRGAFSSGLSRGGREGRRGWLRKGHRPTGPKANQTSPSQSRCPAFYRAVAAPVLGGQAALGNDTPWPALPRAEAIKGPASVAGAQAGPGYGLAQ